MDHIQEHGDIVGGLPRCQENVDASSEDTTWENNTETPRSYIMTMVIILRFYNPFRARAYQPTAALTSI